MGLCKNRALRKVFWPKRDQGTGCIMSRFMSCTAHQKLFG